MKSTDFDEGPHQKRGSLGCEEIISMLSVAQKRILTWCTFSLSTAGFPVLVVSIVSSIEDRSASATRQAKEPCLLTQALTISKQRNRRATLLDYP